MGKVKLNDALVDGVTSAASELGVRVTVSADKLVTDQPFETGVILGYTLCRQEVAAASKKTPPPTSLTHALEADVVVRTRAQDLRRECLRRLASMHNIVALRSVKLEALDASELQSLAIVLQGIESKLSAAERKAREPWRRGY